MSGEQQYLKIAITDKEVQYRTSNYSNIEDVLKQSLKCTVCCEDLSGQILRRYSCLRHSILQVLVCKKCKEFYENGYFSNEEDGTAKYCRWCGDGGRLLLCDKCDSGFCKACVRRNFSRSFYKKVDGTDKWDCFICAPEALYPLRATAWAARQVCKKRREEEKDKDKKKGKKTRRRRELSSLESSFASPAQSSARQQQTTSRGNCSNVRENSENRGDPVFPTKLSKVNTECRRSTYKNPVLLQAKTEMKNFFSSLAGIQNSANFKAIESEFMKDKECDSFPEIEQLELLMQQHVIGLIENLNRFSMDLSSRLTQLQRLYLFEENQAREYASFEQDCTVRENEEVKQEDAAGKSETSSDEDEIISVSSSHFSVDSVFSSVSTSRNQLENGGKPGEKPSDSDSDAANTGFSMVNLGASSTPNKLELIGSLKMEVVSDDEVVEEGVGSVKRKEEGEEEGEKSKNDGKTFTQDDIALRMMKLLDDDDDDDSNDSLGEEEGLEGGLGRESLESEDEEEEEGSEDGVEEEGENNTVVERKSVEVPVKEVVGGSDDNKDVEEEVKEERQGDEEEEEEKKNGMKEIDDQNDHTYTQKNKNNGMKEIDDQEEVDEREKVDKNEKGSEKSMENDSHSETVVEGASVKDSQEPTDEKKTQSSGTETDFSQKDADKTTVEVEKLKSVAGSCDSDSSTFFVDDEEKTVVEDKEKPEKDDKIEKSDSETDSKKDEKESKSKKDEKDDDDDWDDIRRLSNLNSVDRNKRKAKWRMLSEEGSDSGSDDKSKKRSSKKKAKKSKEEYNILDNLNDSQGDNEDNADSDDEACVNLASELDKSRHSPSKSKSMFSDFSDSEAATDKNGTESEEPAMEKKAKNKRETKEKSDKDGDSSDSSIFELRIVKPQKRPSWRRDSLLTGKLSSTDEEEKDKIKDEKEEEEKKKKKKEKKRKKREKPMFRKSVSESGEQTESVHLTESGISDREITETDDNVAEKAGDSSDSSVQFVLSTSKRRREVSSSGSIQSISSMDERDDRTPLKKKTQKTWPRKKRIKINVDDSSTENGSSCEEVANFQNTSSQSPGGGTGGRRNIRKVMKDEDVTAATRKAIREEEERKQRVLNRQQKLNDSFGISDGSAPIVDDRLVLDFDTESKKELVSVDKNLVAQMKPHQVEGVKFMWDACFESVEAIKDGEGGGCILAHCMGLGKTFQVVSLVHTLLMHRQLTKVRRVMICCPLSTVLNWYSEFQKWLAKLPFNKRISLHHLANDKTLSRRVSRLNSWHEGGGVMIIGYEMFRSLTNEDKKVIKSNYKTVLLKTLLNPGADLVICDEGHTLKNLKTALSQQMNKIQTKRRIVLTGTPLQNNLIEYHCMMNFVKPNYLGTKKEFINRFVNPITNGQFVNSTEHDFKVMKRRAHVLHKMLDGITQRRDYRELMTYLPPKQEYVISIRLTELQTRLMKTFLEQIVEKRLFKDFQSLNRLWSHPLTLKYSMDRKLKKPDGKVANIDNAFNDHTSDSDVQILPNNDEDAGTSKTKDDDGKSTTTKEGEGAVNKEWWEKLITEEQMNDVTVSSKFMLLFAFMKECEKLGEKMLIFSQSLASLDVMEHFMSKLDQQQCNKENEPGDQTNKSNRDRESRIGQWKKGVDYFRLDGSTLTDNREKWVTAFNKPTSRSRVFLISTRAGGLGINLTAANRVVLFDASWNPSNDIQSIFRVFRFGQDKPCYIYRFIAQGTMEEKIYDRQISKLSLSIRVVDEQQVNRHYSESDLQELYKFTPADPDDRPIPIVPKDRLLCDMLEEHSSLIYKVFMHDSLLSHVEEEELDEEEQKAAWEDYKNEKKNAQNLDRIQSSSVPPDAVAMLVDQFKDALSPEQLNRVVLKSVEDWRRRQIDLLTGVTSKALPTNPASSNNQGNKHQIPNSMYQSAGRFANNAATKPYTADSTKWPVALSNTYAGGTMQANRMTARRPTTSTNFPSTIRNANANNAYLTSNSAIPASRTMTSSSTSSSNAIPASRTMTSSSTSSSNAIPASRMMPSSSTSSSNAFPASRTMPSSSTSSINAIPASRTMPSSSTSSINAIPASRTMTSSSTSSSNAVPASRTMVSSSAIQTTMPKTITFDPSTYSSNAVPTTKQTPASRMTTSSSKFPSTSRSTFATDNSLNTSNATSKSTTASNTSSIASTSRATSVINPPSTGRTTSSNATSNNIPSNSNQATASNSISTSNLTSASNTSRARITSVIQKASTSNTTSESKPSSSENKSNNED
ncbi:transcriptional regulator ATRX isoform X3 [Nilaparvata lugens]|uniref:transcriptional regulator ATRX isoform X3 n=1 Tax=Nilaparvata lugens TaxID=108931 RepID=UPI00193D7671|nr:transcriptional regulator ATRX isoform X3 [Nilaparvata lugens]